MSSGRFVLLWAAGFSALLVGAASFGAPSHATAAVACPPGVASTFSGLSRPIVPIGYSALRLFAVEPHVVTDVQLSAPAEYNAVQVPSNLGYGLRFKAPHAGAFDVQATWTEMYYDGSATVPCTATGNVTLTASSGVPLKLKPPREKRVTGNTQVENPAVWTWKCSAGSNPTPLSVRVRWEIDLKSLPVGSRGGHAPFRFTRRAKTFSFTTGDPCDFRQSAEKTVKLPHSAKLGASAGRYENGGSLTVSFLGADHGIFRNPKGNAAPLHVGIALSQGNRSLVSSRLCAWYDSSFAVARGKNVSCWW